MPIKTPIMIRATEEIRDLVQDAAKRLNLSQSEIIRQGLLLGIPELVHRLRRPRRSLVEYLDQFSQLEIKPNRSAVKSSRWV